MEPRALQPQACGPARTVWYYFSWLVILKGCLKRGEERSATWASKEPKNASKEELAQEVDKLQRLMEDLKNQAERDARRNQAEVTSQASGWMDRVATLAANASKVISEISSATLVGAEESLQQITGYIDDEDIGIIGIWGTGGAGKTSLLNVINNEFLTGEVCRDKFEVSIRVTVSREAKDTSDIMKAIIDRLGFTEGSSNDRIFFELSNKRFILLLDQVWEKVDLVEIGVPLSKNLNNKSKVLFTTRSEEVCREMDADEMVKVGSLDAERSWQLFRSKFGRASTPALDNPEIQPLAKDGRRSWHDAVACPFR
ncbi:hypothetical protein Taro_037478 [Colocasia esculenta]|uniref:NB-ARC domain-containing protein n=1 Tax=Colocasia esculenta TaxID=4460 RepID=A0A843W9V9_COLES|nr:hypothetical protein [Colocasia esculenta]